MTIRADWIGHSDWALRVHFAPGRIQVPWALACRTWRGAVPTLHHMEQGTMLHDPEHRDVDEALECLLSVARMLHER